MIRNIHVIHYRIKPSWVLILKRFTVHRPLDLPPREVENQTNREKYREGRSTNTTSVNWFITGIGMAENSVEPPHFSCMTGVGRDCDLATHQRRKRGTPALYRGEPREKPPITIIREGDVDTGATRPRDSRSTGSANWRSAELSHATAHAIPVTRGAQVLCKFGCV